MKYPNKNRKRPGMYFHVAPFGSTYYERRHTEIYCGSEWFHPKGWLRLA